MAPRFRFPASALFALAALAALAVAADAASAQTGDLNWPSKQFVKPRDIALSYPCGGGKICDLADFMERQHVCALVVLKGGELVIHRTSVRSDDDPCASAVARDRYGISSLAKSVVSLLFGLVYADPDYAPPVDLDSPAADALAAAGLPIYDERVTLRQLLHMASGMDWSEDEINSTLKIQVDENARSRRRVRQAEGRRRRPPGARAVSRAGQVPLFRLRHAAPRHPDRAPADARQGLHPRHARRGARALLMAAPAHGEERRVERRFRRPSRRALLRLHLGARPRHAGRLGAEGIQRRRGRRGGLDPRLRQRHDRCEFRAASSRERSATFRFGYHWWVPSADAQDGFTGIGTQGQYLHVFPGQDVVVAQLSEKLATDADTCEAMLVHRLIADSVDRN